VNMQQHTEIGVAVQIGQLRELPIRAGFEDYKQHNI